jgi:hypothetical protein
MVCNHHFVLPKDGTPFLFLPGEYTVEVYATLVNSSRPLLLSRTHLQLSHDESTAIGKGSGVYFDWGPDSKHYHSHIDSPRARDEAFERSRAVTDVK